MRDEVVSLPRQPETTPRKEMKEELDTVINADPLTTVCQEAGPTVGVV